MPSIRIEDKKQTGSGNYLDFAVHDILTAIGESVLKSRWIARDLECVRKCDGGAEQLREKRLKFSGEEILKWSARAGLIINGRFEARGQGPAKRLWLIIIAFDTTFYDVWSSKTHVLEKIRARFNNVSDIPKIVENLKLH
jgi:hypothetical protein